MSSSDVWVVCCWSESRPLLQCLDTLITRITKRQEMFKRFSYWKDVLWEFESFQSCLDWVVTDVWLARTEKGAGFLYGAK